jgi:hypothetical protein
MHLRTAFFRLLAPYERLVPKIRWSHPMKYSYLRKYRGWLSSGRVDRECWNPPSYTLYSSDIVLGTLMPDGALLIVSGTKLSRQGWVGFVVPTEAMYSDLDKGCTCTCTSRLSSKMATLVGSWSRCISSELTSVKIHFYTVFHTNRYFFMIHTVVVWVLSLRRMVWTDCSLDAHKDRMIYSR